MTVASTTNRKSFSGDGVTTSFGTSPVVFYESTDLVVEVFSSAGVATTLTEGTQYTVSGGSSTGATGTVNLAGGTAPYGAPAVGTTLLIRRVLPLVQEADFVNNDINDAEVSETALDKLTMIAQQQEEDIGRAIKVAASEGEQDPVVVTGKAGYYLRRNIAGTAFELAVGDINTSTFTQSGVGAVERSVTAKLGETVSVKDFGAVGDGVTDDTAAVNAWLVALAAGNVGYVPAGTYIVEACPLLSNTTIRGAGETQAVFKLKTAASTPQIFIADTKSNIAISGVGFDCNNVTSGVAIQATTVVNLRVEACRFTSKYGIYLLGTCEDVQISGNTFDANSYGVITHTASATSHVLVHGNTFKDCTADGVEINCPTGSGQNWVITGNTFDTIGSNGANSGFGVGASGGTSYIDGLAISGNSFFRCDHQAVHIEDGCRNVSITGNTIRDTGYGGTQTLISGVYVSCALALNRAISNVSIVGNTIIGVSDMDYGIYLGGNFVTPGIVVDGNSVSGALLYGVLLGSVLRAFTVKGNSFFDNTGPGIRVAGTRGTIVGNVSTKVNGAQTYGIEINTGTDLVITDNVLTGNDTGAILITSGLTTSILRNNRGYVTENNGTGSIASGATSTTITHGLSVAPTRPNISITLAENPTNTPGAVYVTNITSTQFTVNVENDPGASNLDFAWQAIVL